jgi:hypothetical protein
MKHEEKEIERKEGGMFLLGEQKRKVTGEGDREAGRCRVKELQEERMPQLEGR